MALDQIDVRDTRGRAAGRAEACRGEADRRRAAGRGVLPAIDLDRRTDGERQAQCRRHQQSFVVGERQCGAAPASPPAQVAAQSSPTAAPTPAGNVAQQAVPDRGSIDCEIADGFSVGVVRSHQERSERPGQQRCDSRDGRARCARGRGKESSDARQIAGDVLREHEHSQRRRARGDGRAGSPAFAGYDRRFDRQDRSAGAAAVRAEISGGDGGVGQVKRESQRADEFCERTFQRARGAGQRRDRKFRSGRAARKRKAGAVEKFQRRDRTVRSRVAQCDRYRSEERRDASVSCGADATAS